MRHFRHPWQLGILLTLAAALVTGGRAGAQQGQGQYVTEATQRLSRLIAKANQDGFSLDKNQPSTGGAWLTPSKTQWVKLFTVTLQTGQRYRFLATGDNDARDVDIDVSDPNGKIVAKDDSTAVDATLEFTPSETQEYIVRVRLYASRENVPCMCLGMVLAKR